MKKQLLIAGLALLMVSTLYSCKKGFEKLNIDPINILETSSDKLLAPALVNSIWPGMSRNRSFTNELMQVTVSLSDGENTVFRYAFRASQSDYLWNSWYVQLTNFRSVDSLASSGGKINTSYQGIARICEAWLFANLTDTYGDIPYKEALGGKQGNVQPVFDRQKDIYQGMFNKLEEANELLAGNTPIVLSSDPVFNGDISKWRKLGNSLYLRLLLRISGKAEVAQQCQEKIKAIVENPANYPIMTSNADCARVLWTGDVSSTDPYTSPYVYNIRVQDFRSPAICSYFLDSLNTWSDPRLTSAKPYGSGSIGRLGIAQASGGGWRGVASGYEPGKGQEKGCYFQSYDNTSTGGVWSLQQNPRTGIIMQYAEVQFILAEAALKGWIGGDAKDYFYQGMASAINYWVPDFPEDVNSTNFATHLENLAAGSVIWDDNTSPERKMELIHGQKYYALFLTDLQQWFEYRRTGYPNLHLDQLKGLQNNSVMPARLVYPVYVQSANPTNYKAAVAAQGVDQINTNVWWQKP
ncbi:SusD/RagB family nutrient-binding outer membrane lipoprotein [Niabella beijingensis]|uniref:SusD/RagB family nutrient-binding outer membrane lipoprotein n=1 Tax=Niabella beijingensis TaxID=2872700 RepID=UPI001CC09610|nr:SusD/RagB family nutrient-binding outer membrane lipoprotein [Niabella beijingensis]MBZ4189265.1 SusD/RagB family nutrient-binding outer membrane lipoprotein [Niabella beijingensis]